MLFVVGGFAVVLVMVFIVVFSTVFAVGVFVSGDGVIVIVI